MPTCRHAAPLRVQQTAQMTLCRFASARTIAPVCTWVLPTDASVQRKHWRQRGSIHLREAHRASPLCSSIAIRPRLHSRSCLHAATARAHRSAEPRPRPRRRPPQPPWGYPAGRMPRRRSQKATSIVPELSMSMSAKKSAIIRSEMSAVGRSTAGWPTVCRCAGNVDVGTFPLRPNRSCWVPTRNVQLVPHSVRQLVQLDRAAPVHVDLPEESVPIL